jgi:hypothetical protein
MYDIIIAVALGLGLEVYVTYSPTCPESAYLAVEVCADEAVCDTYCMIPTTNREDLPYPNPHLHP